MRKLATLICLITLIALFAVKISTAQGCKEGKEMLDKTLSIPPNEMTEEFIKEALNQCRNKVPLYSHIAEYYKKWYMTELNPEKNSKFKRLSESYSRKAHFSSKGSESEVVVAKLPTFSPDEFRALRPVSPGTTGSGLNLKIFFKFDSYELSNTVQAHLDQLGGLLTEKKSTRINLTGHTDIVGSAEYNKELSFKRAESAKNYLVKKYKLEPKRISTAGYGFERLANPGDPFSSNNRRVEVIKLSK